MASCFIWRREYTEERPESFSDRESLHRRNKRVRNAVLCVMILFLLGIAAVITGEILAFATAGRLHLPDAALSLALYVAIVGYCDWVVRSINRNLDR